MKTKLSKIAKTVCVGIFFIALLLNVRFTLEDPFLQLSPAVIAQTTSSGTGENVCWDTITGADGVQTRYCGTCDYVSNSKPSFWASKGKC